MAQGKITEADTLTIRLGAIPSRLINGPPPSSPIFVLDALPSTTLPLYLGLGQALNMLACIPSGVVILFHNTCQMLIIYLICTSFDVRNSSSDVVRFSLKAMGIIDDVRKGTGPLCMSALEHLSTGVMGVYSVTLVDVDGAIHVVYLM